MVGVGVDSDLLFDFDFLYYDGGRVDDDAPDEVFSLLNLALLVVAVRRVGKDEIKHADMHHDETHEYHVADLPPR